MAPLKERDKVIVISACYSGGYIAPLKDDRTLIMTAARPDRVSFGCSEEADFTYFGDALFAEALNQTDDLKQAFELARASVAERERREGFEASEPQLWAPPAVLAHWQSLRRQQAEEALRNEAQPVRGDQAKHLRPTKLGSNKGRDIMYLTPQHVLLAGATGLTGEHLLDRLLNEPTISRVLAPTRRPLAEHPHLENPVGDPAVFLPQLAGRVDIAFCCLGTTLKQAGSETAFRAVDWTWSSPSANEPGKWAPVTCWWSAPWAPTPNRRSSTTGSRARWKKHSRPGLATIDHRPTFAAAGRPCRTPGKRTHCRPFARLIPGKYRGIEACTLARALWRLALEEEDGIRIVESDELRKLGKK